MCGALLTVTEARGKRWLSLGSVIQSIVFVDADGRAKLTQAEEWTQLLTVCADAWMQRLAPVDGTPQRALLLGVGGGIVARSLLALNATVSLWLVELEQDVLEASQRFFGLMLDDERCTVRVLDASAFLEWHAAGAQQPFDVIVVDCFTDEGLAPGVADGGLLRHLPGCVAEGGLCVLNTTWSGARGEDARRWRLRHPPPPPAPSMTDPRPHGALRT